MTHSSTRPRKRRRSGRYDLAGRVRCTCCSRTVDGVRDREDQGERPRRVARHLRTHGSGFCVASLDVVVDTVDQDGDA